MAIYSIRKCKKGKEDLQNEQKKIRSKPPSQKKISKKKKKKKETKLGKLNSTKLREEKKRKYLNFIRK